jgi:aspartyl-tRNA(Asn)/glutamyl-tRNA(Gln) amidotransferase subunit C
MQIKDVENLAELARIDLTEEEKMVLLKDLDDSLAYVQVIESVEIDSFAPEYTLYNTWREDEEQVRDFSKELIKEQFPDSQDGFLKVKKIL